MHAARRYICRHLRPHQREGVAFMYSRIEGQSGDAQTGAVLADAMGLGRAYTCAPVTNTHQLLAGFRMQALC